MAEEQPGKSSQQFPYKLHRILNGAEKEGFDDIIAWSPTGKSFRIFSKERLEDNVMPRYFSSNKYKSFQRNLNIWGFTRVQETGEENGNIANPLFIRGLPDLCSRMTRVKNKGLYRRGYQGLKSDVVKAVNHFASATAAPRIPVQLGVGANSMNDVSSLLGKSSSSSLPVDMLPQGINAFSPLRSMNLLALLQESKRLQTQKDLLSILERCNTQFGSLTTPMTSTSSIPAAGNLSLPRADATGGTYHSQCGLAQQLAQLIANGNTSNNNLDNSTTTAQKPQNQFILQNALSQAASMASSF